jgi:putative transposase
MALFSDSDRKRLESNTNVEKVTKSHVVYTLKFKILALKKHDQGIPPKRIFTDAGIDLILFPQGYAKNTIRRWRKIGPEGIKVETRGSGTPTKKKNGFSSLEQEIAQLKAEIWILKKLQASAGKQKK